MLLSILGGLANSFRDLSGLAHASTDTALFVTDDHQSGEPHVAAALNGLGDAVDSNQTILEFAFLSVALHLSAASFIRIRDTLHGPPQQPPQHGQCTHSRRDRTPRSCSQQRGRAHQ